jgi:hypothetical protein
VGCLVFAMGEVVSCFCLVLSCFALSCLVLLHKESLCALAYPGWQDNAGSFDYLAPLMVGLAFSYLVGLGLGLG